MTTFTINIDKAGVLEEVAKTTSYIGKKKDDKQDTGAYDRIFTTDADNEMLERFWQEACSEVACLLRPFIAGTINTDGFTVLLDMPKAFDMELKDTINKSLRSYIVNEIVGKWSLLTNKEEINDYKRMASVYLADAKSKLFYRKRPTRSRIF